MFNVEKQLLTGELNVKLKKSMVRSVMWSTVTFANERWALQKYETDRLKAFQMWVWRRILKIS